MRTIATDKPYALAMVIPGARKYVGLETPPVITGKVPGKHFVLHTKNLASIERDVPVYYRKFSVDKVEDVKFNQDGESVTAHIFINAPYDQWVNKTTKFWNASGVDFSMNTEGFNIDTESLGLAINWGNFHQYLEHLVR